jgi:hypothetical protein
MISLTYLSTASRTFDPDELEALLPAWRVKNGAAGLSGMLLYVDGHFIQTLEGEEDDVDAAYEQIRNDPRHRDVDVALREEIEERHFAEWTMGFTRLSAEDAAATPGFNDYLDPGSELYAKNSSLGRAGIFHRVFRDNMRR